VIARSSPILLTTLLLFAPGCFGEAAAKYRGTVASAPQPGYSFEPEENPGKLTPIPGAEVRLCVCNQPCACKDEGQTVMTDARGHFETKEVGFPGMIGISNYVVVRVSAKGFDPIHYTCDYDHRSDADRAREPSYGEKALNVRLAPAGAH